MPNENIVNYIKQARAAGMGESEIKSNLLTAGWKQQEIDEAWKAQAMPVVSVVEPTTSGKWQNFVASVKANKKILMIVGFLVILGLAGFFAYPYLAASNPSKVWQTTVKKMAGVESAKFKFEAWYSETNTGGSESDSFLSFLGQSGELKISATGEGSMLIKPDRSDVDYGMNSTVATKLGSLNISLGFESRKIGDNVYYKLDGNPLAAIFGGSQEEEKKPEWMKINLKDSGYEEISELSDIQKEQLLDAFNKASLMKPVKFLGTEKINGASTLHYSAELDKNELKAYLSQAQKILDKDKESDYASLIDKLEFKRLEVWIGKTDRMLYRALIETNAPSFFNMSMGSTAAKSRDASRLAETQQIQSALEIYFDEKGAYPKNLEDALVENIFSSNLGNLPKAPTPADGPCSEQDNEYVYQQLDNGKNYKLSFCLGTDFSGFKAGIVEAGPQGRQNKTSDVSLASKDEFENLQFTGTIHVQLDLSDFNKKFTVEEPKDAYDAGASSRDSRRFSDVQQIRTALELFFVDTGYYPFSKDGDFANEKIKDYLSPVPTAPTPPDGNCSEENNRYYYTWLDAGNYSLTFCLGSDLGDYGPGTHTLSPSGIE